MDEIAAAALKMSQKRKALASLASASSSSDGICSHGPARPPIIRIDGDPTQAEADAGAVASGLYLNDSQGDPKEPGGEGSQRDDGSTDSAAAEASLPAIRIEINKVVFTITKATIAIAMDGDAADVRLSLEVAPAGEAATAGTGSRISSDVADVVKSIKTSLKSSKRVFLGAANKLFKQAAGRSYSVGKDRSSDYDSQQQQQQQQYSGTADTDQLEGTTSQHCSVEAGGRGTDSVETSIECDRTKRGAATGTSSQENTIDSDPTQRPGSPHYDSTRISPGPKLEKARTLKLLSIFPGSKASQQDAVASSSSSSQAKSAQEPSGTTAIFPNSMPEKTKTFFDVTRDTKLIATVFAADTTAAADELKQVKKSPLILDPTKQKLKIGNKKRSVWLDPTAGEKIEIWKVYYDGDDKCKMMLARLPGTADIYGYVLPQEIDTDKQFDTSEERTAYAGELRCLPFQQDIYDDTEEMYM